jgi:hypothetical protein
LLKQDYLKPGSGVSKDEPKKKGIRRYVQLLAFGGWELYKLNLICLVVTLPSAILFALGVLDEYAFVLSAIAALPIGGALVACFFCISMILRDYPGYLGHDFSGFIWKGLNSQEN